MLQSGPVKSCSWINTRKRLCSREPQVRGARTKLLRDLHDIFLPEYQALKPHDSTEAGAVNSREIAIDESG